MFTGLVEGMARVREVVVEGPGVRLGLEPPAECRTPGEAAALGESIAVSGCCLTVIEGPPDTWTFQAGPETLAKTNLGRLRAGAVVNVERSLPVNGRLGGHFVQGHVDGVGAVDEIVPQGEWTDLVFRVPADLARFMVPKGSVAVDGVSLTLVRVEATRFSVALIPHTLRVTTLGRLAVGDVVNIETDLLAKYVDKLWGAARA